VIQYFSGYKSIVFKNLMFSKTRGSKTLYSQKLDYSRPYLYMLEVGLSVWGCVGWLKSKTLVRFKTPWLSNLRNSKAVQDSKHREFVMPNTHSPKTWHCPKTCRGQKDVGFQKLTLSKTWHGLKACRGQKLRCSKTWRFLHNNFKKFVDSRAIVLDAVLNPGSKHDMTKTSMCLKKFDSLQKRAWFKNLNRWRG